MARTLIVVPARLASKRLARKVLLPIAGKALLIWACESAERGRQLLQQSGEQVELWVACESKEIVDCAEQHGFSAVLTDADLPSGSDRVHQALERIDPRREAEIVVNCQADLPLVEPRVFANAVAALRESTADIATPIVSIGRTQAQRSSVVKAIVAEGAYTNVACEQKNREEREEKSRVRLEKNNLATYRVLAFTRACAPWSGEEEKTDEARYWHHIGLYAYRRESLSRFVSLPPSVLERREGLEQMRALENGMTIVAFVCSTAPQEINLEEERAAFEQQVLDQQKLVARAGTDADTIGAETTDTGARGHG